MTPSDLDEIRKRCEAMPARIVLETVGYNVPYEVPTDECGAAYEHARTDVPRLLDEIDRLNRRVAQLESNRPKCMGTWLKGSGGHRQYAHDCPNPGRWDVMGGGYVCDEHKSTSGADDDAWTVDDELTMLRDAISEDKESLVERSLMYKAKRDVLHEQVEDLKLKLRVSEEQFDALGDANVLDIEKERLCEQLRHMKKHVEQNDDEYRVMKDVLRAEHQTCQELREQVERLQREVADLRNRPPMNCTACEDHNQELADKNRELEHENDELHEAISDDAAATLADRNEIRQHLNEVLDALVFASDPIDMNAFTLGP